MDVTLRSARRGQRGVRVFYVRSFTDARVEYAVQHVRLPGQRRWACACPGYFHTWSVRRRHCKHILLVRRWLAGVGGMRRTAGRQATVAIGPVTPKLDLVFEDAHAAVP